MALRCFFVNCQLRRYWTEHQSRDIHYSRAVQTRFSWAHTFRLKLRIEIRRVTQAEECLAIHFTRVKIPSPHTPPPLPRALIHVHRLDIASEMVFREKSQMESIPRGDALNESRAEGITKIELIIPFRVRWIKVEERDFTERHREITTVF